MRPHRAEMALARSGSDDCCCPDLLPSRSDRFSSSNVTILRSRTSRCSFHCRRRFKNWSSNTACRFSSLLVVRPRVPALVVSNLRLSLRFPLLLLPLVAIHDPLQIVDTADRIIQLDLGIMQVPS